MQVTMLGADYSYANQMLGTDWGAVWDGVMSVANLAKDVAVEELKTKQAAATSQAQANAFQQAINLITATGSTQAAAAAAKQNATGGFNWQANAPWLIIGGVGIVALLFVIGTRKRR